MRNVAIVLAAGRGSRLGAEVPKQFLEIGGKTILEYSLDTFERHELIDEIAVVANEEYVENVALFVRERGYRKVRHVLKGGIERYNSSLVAIETYASSDCNLLIHDAARPFVTTEIVTSCVEALQSYEAVCVAVPTSDTILELSEEGYIARIPPRKLLRNAQTPQCFRVKTIAKAFELGLQDPMFSPTDDSSVVLRYMPEVPIKVVLGDERNKKITFKTDIENMKNLFPNK